MFGSLLLSTALSMTAAAPQGQARPAAEETAHLVYDLPELASTAGGEALDEAMSRVEAVLDRRLGTLARFERGDGASFTLSIEGASERKITYVRRSVEVAGRFEIRLLARATNEAGERRADLEAERGRLRAWLDDGGRARLRADRLALRTFEAATGKEGGEAPTLRWFVRPLTPIEGAPERWLPRLSEFAALADIVVEGYDEAEWNGGVIPESWKNRPAIDRRLPELMALDMEAGAFTNDDLLTTRTKVVRAITGGHGVRYEIRPDRAEAFGDWSERHLDRYYAVLIDDEIVATPRFGMRAAAAGTIGNLGRERAHALAAAIRRPLPALPVLRSIERNGPNR